MNCESCGVSVDPAHAVCPLCQRRLVHKGMLPSTANGWYPVYRIEENQQNGRFISKVLALIAVAVISLCLLINGVGKSEVWWSLYLIPCVLYAWLLIRHTVMSRSHPGAKIIIQVIALASMLLWIDLMAGAVYWSTGYVIPFLLMAATLLITVICNIGRMRWREFTGSLLMLIVLSFAPLLLYVVGMSQVLWTAIAAAMYGLFTFGGMWLLADTAFRKEVKRRLHF